MKQVRCYTIEGLAAIEQGIALTHEGMIALGQVALPLPNISTVRAGRLEAMPVSNEQAAAVVAVRAVEGASWELVRPYPAGTVVTEFPPTGEGAADALLVVVPGTYHVFVREADGRARLVTLTVSEDGVISI
jgi:hypothetical protein